MATTYTTNRLLSKQATGDNVNAWGPVLNTNFDLIDSALGSQVAISITSANVTLTATQAQAAVINATGAMTNNFSIILPITQAGFTVVRNNTTGNKVLTIASAGGGTSVIAPNGVATFIYTDGTNVVYADDRAVTSGTFGQCRLTFTSSTVITLSPYNGNLISIAGTPRSISNSSPPTLAATGLSVGTVYYIYAYWDGTNIQLEASTTSHGPSSSALNMGCEVKNGDLTRTLVGVVVPTTGPNFINSAVVQYVRSWFNRVPVQGETLSTGFTSSSASPVQLWNIINAYIWSDEVVTATISGTVASNTAFYGSSTRISMDGSPQVAASVTSSTASANCNYHVSKNFKPGEGIHYFTPEGYVDGNTSTWNPSGLLSVRT